MSMEESSWLPLAQALERGSKARVNHTCLDDRSMIVSAGDKGWSAFCFRCGSAFKHYPALSLEEQLALLRNETQEDEQARQSIALPGGANYEVETWPIQSKVWLYKAGFSIPEIKSLGWYWSQRTSRVILPIWKDGQPIFWQGRNCTDKVRPKYLAPAVDRSTITFQRGTGSLLVLTEDILSAAKVGRNFMAWSIMGTKLPDKLLASVVAEGKPVAVWLDPDKAGREGAAKIANSLRAVGVAVAIVRSDRDPKFYCDGDIHEHLSSCAFH